MRIARQGASQRKSPAVSRQGFFFVAEDDEISNLELILDIIEISELIEPELT
jgi:hypothetical protein